MGRHLTMILRILFTGLHEIKEAIRHMRTDSGLVSGALLIGIQAFLTGKCLHEPSKNENGSSALRRPPAIPFLLGNQSAREGYARCPRGPSVQ